MLKVKAKSALTSPKSSPFPPVISTASPTSTETVATSPSSLVNPSLFSFIGPKPTSKHSEVFLPKFVHLVSSPSSFTTSSTALPLNEPGVSDTITEDAAEPDNEITIKPITESAEAKFFAPSIPPLQSPISTSPSSVLDYDIENLKEIEIIGNTVSDDDEEYFEDYYNFPFGSRITSFISSRENASKSRSINVAADDLSDDTDEKKDVNGAVIDEDISASTTVSYSPVHEDNVVRLVAARSGNTFVPEHYTN